MPIQNLTDFTPKLEGNHSSFVSEENKRRHVGENPDKLFCRLYKVDGYILASQTGKRCDYLLVNDEGKDAYFVELKGVHIDDAIEQIDATIEALENSLVGYFFFRRIICSKAGTHKLKSSRVQFWRKKHNQKHHGQQAVIIKENQHSDKMVR